MDLVKPEKLPSEHNPLTNLRYGAEPCALVEGDRVYLLMTAERPQYDADGVPLANVYGDTSEIAVLSSTDLVNWTDHGTLPIAGANGVARWARFASSPSVVKRGEYYYLYFSDGSRGIGVVRATALLGPYDDPLGRPLIDRDTPECADVPWLSSASALVDGDRAYLAFGGGRDKASTRVSARIVELTADMLRLAGKPVAIDAPAYFESALLQKRGQEYLFSYCTAWLDEDERKATGLGACQIVWMRSDSPFGPYRPGGTLLLNPGEYFGCYGNNHHDLFTLGGKWYVAYHTHVLEQLRGRADNYRCIHLNAVEPLLEGGFALVKADREGVCQLASVDPYREQTAMTFACVGGMRADRADIEPCLRSLCGGSWLRVSGVDFGDAGAGRLRVLASAASETELLVYADTMRNAPAVRLRLRASEALTEYEIAVEPPLCGKHELFFVCKAQDVCLSAWRFGAAEHVAEPAWTLVSARNPVIPMDFPDPDVIRVGETYYMASTTMHFLPACAILRSFDLLHWELAAHVAASLGDTPALRLEGDENIYGQGMWAASLRYYADTFYVSFVERDQGRTLLYRAPTVEGPWTCNEIQGYYYDSSLLFDDDGHVYIVHGNTTIRVTELNDELNAPRKNGLRRVLVKERDNRYLGYEGSHIQKIGGLYYLFLIHSLPTEWKRVQACFVSDSLRNRFTGGDVLNDDMGFFGQGIAQGGLIDTPRGDWYAMLFQDRGAAGRMPVLVPVRWHEDMPVLGEGGRVPETVGVYTTKPDWAYRPLYGDDDFDGALSDAWEWNHQPDASCWTVGDGALAIRTAKRCDGLLQAVNTLTQRMLYPRCAAEVTLDASELRDGDCAGLCALQGDFAQIGLRLEHGEAVLFAHAKTDPDQPEGAELARVPWTERTVTLRLEADFTDLRDVAILQYLRDGEWTTICEPHALRFRLDHFTGCRFGLYAYSTQKEGGIARFRRFRYRMP